MTDQEQPVPDEVRAHLEQMVASYRGHAAQHAKNAEENRKRMGEQLAMAERSTERAEQWALVLRRYEAGQVIDQLDQAVAESSDCPGCEHAKALARTCAQPAGEPPAHLPGCQDAVSGGVPIAPLSDVHKLAPGRLED